MKIRDKLVEDFAKALNSNELIITKVVNPNKESFHTVVGSDSGPLFFKRIENLDDESTEDSVFQIHPAKKWAAMCNPDTNPLLNTITEDKSDYLPSQENPNVFIHKP